MFSHVASPYDVLKQPLVYITAPHSPYHVFSYGNIRRAIKVLSTSKVVDEEGLQVEFLKHDIHSLNTHIVDLFNHVVCSSFPQA
jgi:hypothetical protein